MKFTIPAYMGPHHRTETGHSHVFFQCVNAAIQKVMTLLNENCLEKPVMNMLSPEW